ncbi:hypothetical protein [Nocardia sp. NPDC003183]
MTYHYVFNFTSASHQFSHTSSADHVRTVCLGKVVAAKLVSPRSPDTQLPSCDINRPKVRKQEVAVSRRSPQAKKPKPETVKKDLQTLPAPVPMSWTAATVDLLALVLILTALVALVVYGNASAAMIAAVGAATAVALRAWHSRRSA